MAQFTFLALILAGFFEIFWYCGATRYVLPSKTEERAESPGARRIAQVGNEEAAFDSEAATEASEHNNRGVPRGYVTLKVSETPAKTVRVTGRQEDITDAFGTSVNVTKYFGIPFALPLVDTMRYQRPTLRILEEDFDAVNEPVPCPQVGASGGIVGEEDCLFLNVFAPDVMVAENEEALSQLPVLVWFHGESDHELSLNILHSGSAAELDPDIFLAKKVIVVSPQYRLGSLGFLSTVNEDLSGNMGLFDQLLALEWVQRFISNFGGDPQQVTLLGHGGSAMSVGLLTTSNLARGLFHRVILMSGSPLSPLAVDQNPKTTFAEVALQNSCPSFPALRFVRCMQKKDVSEVVNADARLVNRKTVGTSKIPTPVIQRDADGRFLPPILSIDPHLAFRTGRFEQVPLLLGVSSAEMAGFLSKNSAVDVDMKTGVFANQDSLKQFIRTILSMRSPSPDVVTEIVSFEYFAGLNVTERVEQAADLLEELLSDYIFHVPAVALAESWSRLAPVYFYVFDYVPSANQGISGEERNVMTGPSQAVHGGDLMFLVNGMKGNPIDRLVSESMLEFWANFIHKGSPLNAGMDWPQFREESRLHLVFLERIEVENSFRIRQVTLLTTLLNKIREQQCPPTRTNSNRNRGSSFRGFENF